MSATWGNVVQGKDCRWFVPVETQSVTEIGVTEESKSVEFSRYIRQMRYAPIGEAGQRKLAAARVLSCGCGALGSVLANTLARAGVGDLRLVDRGFSDLHDLRRQGLAG